MVLSTRKQCGVCLIYSSKYISMHADIDCKKKSDFAGGFVFCWLIERVEKKNKIFYCFSVISPFFVDADCNCALHGYCNTSLFTFFYPKIVCISVKGFKEFHTLFTAAVIDFFSMHLTILAYPRPISRGIVGYGIGKIAVVVNNQHRINHIGYISSVHLLLGFFNLPISLLGSSRSNRDAPMQ
jgi:hypothetical protein